MSLKIPLEYNNFEAILESESNEETFLKEYNDYLSKTRQRCFTKLKANEQKLLDYKEKCQHLDVKMVQQEDLREKVKLNVQTYHKEYQLAIEWKDKLKDEIENLRKQIPELSMKLADIKRVIQQNNDDMKYEWNAIVKACNVYKKYLNIHLKMEQFGDIVEIKITFFVNENPDKNYYYVTLLKQDKKWKIVKIVPELKPEDQNEIQLLPREMDNIHVTILLCKLRNIFLNYKQSS